MMKADLARWDEHETQAAASTLAWLPATGQQDGDVPARRNGDSFLQSLLRLWPGEARRATRPSREMVALRAAFRASLVDLHEGDDERIQALLRHIVHSRSPQDLWHLRASVYTEVARARDQREAERRLAGLNQHFRDKKGHHVRRP
jgi:hypothetical protein